MPNVSNVSLQVQNSANPAAKNVTVSGTINFDASEIGKTYRLAIDLHGEDKPGDKLPATDSVGDDQLYVFTWGPLLAKKPYKQFTVAAPGPQQFTETRAIANEKLDEDAGNVKIADADINTPVYMPRQDEVYAQISVYGAPVSARSPTLITGIGV